MLTQLVYGEGARVFRILVVPFFEVFRVQSENDPADFSDVGKVDYAVLAAKWGICIGRNIDIVASFEPQLPQFMEEGTIIQV